MKQLLFLAVLCLTLSMLSGCPKPIYSDHMVSIQIPATPSAPTYYKVLWSQQGNLVCLDERGAKNEMKNVIMLKAHDKDLETIIEGIRSNATVTVK